MLDHPWRHLKDIYMWTWFSGGFGSVMFMVVLNDLKGVFQLKLFYVSMILIPAPCSFRVTCSLRHTAFFILQLLARTELALLVQEVTVTSNAPVWLCRWLALSASSWLLPVSTVESSKSTAHSCWLRGWSEGEAGRGEANHLQFSCPGPACIFPCHSHTENMAVLQVLPASALRFLPQMSLGKAHAEIWHLLAGKIKSHWKLR